MVVVGAAAAVADDCVSGTGDGTLELDSEFELEPELVPGFGLVPVSCTENVLDPPPVDDVNHSEHVYTQIDIHIICP